MILRDNPLRAATVYTLLLLVLSALPVNAQRKTAFNGDSAYAFLHTISVDIGPRPMGSPAEHRGLEFAVSKFRQYGCDTAYIMPLAHSTRANTSSGIAIGIKRGENGRTICLGGHMDSAGPEIPGTNDDGSGSATVIELARVLAGSRHNSSLLFCCFGGEEEGLEGSRYFTEHFEGMDSIALMLQTDMTNGLGIIELDPDTHGKSAPEWLVRAAIEEFDKLGYENLRYPTHFFSLNYAMEEGSGSDHEYFLRKGIPAIDFTTDVTDPIHTPSDNWDNFDPRGLQRSGDVVLSLVNRFDAGVPPEKTTQYWLYLIGTTPIFLPLNALWITYIIAFGIAVAGLIRLRLRRPKPAIVPFQVSTPEFTEPDVAATSQILPPPGQPNRPRRIRFSTLKIFFFSLIVAGCAWFSPDLVNIMKGVRHAWVIDYQLNYVLGILGAIFGLSIVAKFSSVIKITKDAYHLYRSAFIIGGLAFIGAAFVGTKAALYPALTLLLLGFAVLQRNRIAKLVCLILLPFPVSRLIFSEWSGLLFRQSAFGMPANAPGTALMIQLVVTLSTCLFIWPLLLASFAIVRDFGEGQEHFRLFRSNLWLGGLAAIILGYGTFLAQRPSYTLVWKRDVRVNQKFQFNGDSSKPAFTNVVESSEYLKGLGISHGGTDTLITGKPTWVQISPRTPYDTGWCQLRRSESRIQSGDSLTVQLIDTIVTKFRPYTITISYRSGGKELPSIETPWFTTRGRSGGREIRWYSFPDTNIVVPVTFRVAKGDSITESISVLFDSLAYPMTFTRDLQHVFPRTEYAWKRTYGR